MANAFSFEGYPHSPDWTKDLIVYEIATKGFTSPTGPESGTFRSLQEKLPHLQELGVNAIWLTGHSLSDPKHFYNIWTQYAVIEPDKIDPSLGTEQDFKAMIDAAHRHGIRIFLDVITHGIMNDSPLISRHPDWFKGKSWGMTDYDFDAQNRELDQWWVDLWTRYVVEFNVDGFRLDLGLRRPDLWRQIRANADRAGRPIVLINETEYEHTIEWVVASGLKHIPTQNEFLELIDFAQRNSHTLLDPHHKIPFEPNFDYGRAEKWTVEHWHQWLDRVLGTAGGEGVKWAWSSVQLSCHDDGWEDFTGENPYVAQGSRFIHGYGALFSGMIPIFMAGEEFNAQFTPLPNLSPNLFGGMNPGKGTWLYGGMLQWDDLNDPEHRVMFEDVKRLIAIRKQESDVFAAVPNSVSKNIRRLTYHSDRPGPAPYIRWNDDKAIVVAGNLETESSLILTLEIPLTAMNLAGHKRYRVTDLWTERSFEAQDATLARLECTVEPDKTSGGGVRLLKIEPA